MCDVEGHVLAPRSFSRSMDELAALPSATIPVTIVCSGNRRKEIQMVKKTSGFGWGAGVAGTHEWTGASTARFVHFHGPQKEARHIEKRGV
eukprot:tig00021582_g22635.t1